MLAPAVLRNTLDTLSHPVGIERTIMYHPSRPLMQLLTAPTATSNLVATLSTLQLSNKSVLRSNVKKGFVNG